MEGQFIAMMVAIQQLVWIEEQRMGNHFGRKIEKIKQ
jgi:hypothetical protein